MNIDNWHSGIHQEIMRDFRSKNVAQYEKMILTANRIHVKLYADSMKALEKIDNIDKKNSMIADVNENVKMLSYIVVACKAQIYHRQRWGT